MSELASSPDDEGDRSPRERILADLLQSQTGLLAADVADRLGVHITTARHHLDTLVDAGSVTRTREQVQRAGRPALRYRLADFTYGPEASYQAHPEAEDPYRLLAQVLMEAVSPPSGPRITPEEAGFRWGRDHATTLTTPAHPDTLGTWLASAGGVVDTLQKWGYETEVTLGTDESVRIGLPFCPFADMARERPELVCAVHRGLIRGVLAAQGRTKVDVEIDPFVDPPSGRDLDTYCVAWMRRAHPPAPDQETP